MNDEILYSCKKVESDVPHMGIIFISAIGLFIDFCFFMSWIKWSILNPDIQISIETIYKFFYNGLFIGACLLLCLLLGLIIFPLIYDLFGTEMIYIRDKFLTIDKQALFLHKTRVVGISNIIEISYYNKPKYLPDVCYAFQNEYKVKIKYYGKHLRFKRTLNCGMNFSVEEYTKFGAIMQELIDKSKNSAETK